MKRCPKCQSVRLNEEFYRNGRNKDGLSVYCKLHEDEMHKAWYKRNPDKRRLHSRNWRTKYPGRNKRYELRRVNLTLEEFSKLKNLQKSRCAICGKKVRLCADHSHKTGKHRGLLCNACNVGLGMLQDDKKMLKRAIAYLERWGRHNV